MKHLKKLMIIGSMLGMIGMAGAAEARTTVVISTAPVYAVRPQPYYVNTFFAPSRPVYGAYKSVSYRNHYHSRHGHPWRDRHDRHGYGHGRGHGHR